MRKTRCQPYLLLLLLGVLFSCGESNLQQEALITSIKEHRIEKNRYFKYNANSPLLEEDEPSFEGLNYYPIDLSLRFEGPLVRYETPPPDTIMGTKGDVRPALRYGYFTFTHQGREHRLEIYKILQDDPKIDDYLFLGFTDETSGEATYPGGRYIDLEESPQKMYVVDFNLAYNPYCAYNPKYSCAIPPPENRLSFPVTAGEKIFKEHQESL